MQEVAGRQNFQHKEVFIFVSFFLNPSSASERFTHQRILKPVAKLAGSREVVCMCWGGGGWGGFVVTWGADGGLRGRSASGTSEPETFFVVFFFFS